MTDDYFNDYMLYYDYEYEKYASLFESDVSLMVNTFEDEKGVCLWGIFNEEKDIVDFDVCDFNSSSRYYDDFAIILMCLKDAFQKIERIMEFSFNSLRVLLPVGFMDSEEFDMLMEFISGLELHINSGEINFKETEIPSGDAFEELRISVSEHLREKREAQKEAEKREAEYNEKNYSVMLHQSKEHYESKDDYYEGWSISYMKKGDELWFMTY